MSLARKKPLERGSSLRRGLALVRHNKLRRIGARTEREADEVTDFQLAVYARADGVCERCGHRRPLEAHHIVPRGRGRGWEHLHNAAINGAALCAGDAGCHQRVHRHEAHDWPRWLKTIAQVERALAATTNTGDVPRLPVAIASSASTPNRDHDHE